MEKPGMIWKAFERSGSPELYLLYRQSLETLPEESLRREHVYQNRRNCAPGGRDQRRG